MSMAVVYSLALRRASGMVRVRSSGDRAFREDLLFLKKKKQKGFRSCGLWQQHRHSPQERKFFGYFFQKSNVLVLIIGPVSAVGKLG
jgi:hypothetical protein